MGYVGFHDSSVWKLSSVDLLWHWAWGVGSCFTETLFGMISAGTSGTSGTPGTPGKRLLVEVIWSINHTLGGDPVERLEAAQIWIDVMKEMLTGDNNRQAASPPEFRATA